MSFSYLSIWIDSKPIVWDSSVITRRHSGKKLLSLYTLKTIKVETICVTELCALYTMHKWGNKTKDSVNDCMDDGSVDVGSASVCCRRPHDSAINSFPTLPSLCSLYHTLDLVAITSCFQLQRKKKTIFSTTCNKRSFTNSHLVFFKIFYQFLNTT